MKAILAIDQGTTGTTSLLICAKTLKVLAKFNKEFRQIYPKPSWVEHDPMEIWKTVEESVTTVLSQTKISPSEIECIGITNQRETICSFTKRGEVLNNAIVWQDRRTESFCNSIKSTPMESKIKSITGLPVDAYFSGTKIKWLLENSNSVIEALKNDNLLVGTIDSFLLYKLTGHSVHATDATNASRTMLMDLKTSAYDSTLLEYFGIPKAILPSIKDTFGFFGKTKGLSFLPDGIPITCLIGDQQSALFGQAGYVEGSLKCTYGTGAFLLLNTGKDIISSQNGLVTTVAYKYQGNTAYALEGSTYIAGAAVQFLRDNLKFIKNSSEVEQVANQVKSLEQVENVLFLPFFTGIGSPHWISNAKAAILGLTRDTGISEIAFACLEGIALSINDLVKAFEKDMGKKVPEIRVDGGACANNLLMKMQASSSDLKIVKPKNIETTSLGAAFGASIGNNSFTINDLSKLWEKDCDFNTDLALKNYFEKKKILWNNSIRNLYS